MNPYCYHERLFFGSFPCHFPPLLSVLSLASACCTPCIHVPLFLSRLEPSRSVLSMTSLYATHPINVPFLVSLSFRIISRYFVPAFGTSQCLGHAFLRVISDDATTQLTSRIYESYVIIPPIDNLEHSISFSVRFFLFVETASLKKKKENAQY